MSDFWFVFLWFGVPIIVVSSAVISHFARLHRMECKLNMILKKVHPEWRDLHGLR